MLTCMLLILISWFCLVFDLVICLLISVVRCWLFWFDFYAICLLFGVVRVTYFIVVGVWFSCLLLIALLLDDWFLWCWMFIVMFGYLSFRIVCRLLTSIWFVQFTVRILILLGCWVYCIGLSVLLWVLFVVIVVWIADGLFWLFVGLCLVMICNSIVKFYLAQFR